MAARAHVDVRVRLIRSADAAVDEAQRLVLDPHVNVGVTAAGVAHEVVLDLRHLVGEARQLGVQASMLGLELRFAGLEVVHPLLLLLAAFAGRDTVAL